MWVVLERAVGGMCYVLYGNLDLWVVSVGLIALSRKGIKDRDGLHRNTKSNLVEKAVSFWYSEVVKK